MMNVFVIDVDGVMTDGKFTYTVDGKTSKTFGPDDADGLILLRDSLNICFVSADKKGFEISKKRINYDMGYEIELVSSQDRSAWIDKRFGLQKTIYMGDGFYDFKIFQKVGYSITTIDALEHVKDAADFVTSRKGSERAVAEACIHINEKFFRLIL